MDELLFENIGAGVSGEFSVIAYFMLWMDFFGINLNRCSQFKVVVMWFERFRNQSIYICRWSKVMVNIGYVVFYPCGAEFL